MDPTLPIFATNPSPQTPKIPSTVPPNSQSPSKYLCSGVAKELWCFLLRSDKFRHLLTDSRNAEVRLNSANYVFHCLPGNWETKSLAMRNAAAILDPEGVFFGSTILGEDVHHNFLGRRTMKRFNKTGVVHNSTDDLAGLKRTLDAHFRETTVDIIGTAALRSQTTAVIHLKTPGERLFGRRISASTRCRPPCVVEGEPHVGHAYVVRCGHD